MRHPDRGGQAQFDGLYPPTFRADRRETGGDAGWSRPVARQAHNLKVTGSNPVPATNMSTRLSEAKSFSCECCPRAGGDPVREAARSPAVAVSPRQAHNLKVTGSNPV